MKSIIEITLFNSATGFAETAQVHYSFQNDSFEHEFGTEILPDYILIESVSVGGAEVEDEELLQKYETTPEEIAEEIESELKKDL